MNYLWCTVLCGLKLTSIKTNNFFFFHEIFLANDIHRFAEHFCNNHILFPVASEAMHFSFILFSKLQNPIRVFFGILNFFDGFSVDLLQQIFCPMGPDVTVFVLVILFVDDVIEGDLDIVVSFVLHCIQEVVLSKGRNFCHLQIVCIGEFSFLTIVY